MGHNQPLYSKLVSFGLSPDICQLLNRFFISSSSSYVYLSSDSPSWKHTLNSTKIRIFSITAYTSDHMAERCGFATHFKYFEALALFVPLDWLRHFVVSYLGYFFWAWHSRSHFSGIFLIWGYCCQYPHVRRTYRQLYLLRWTLHRLERTRHQVRLHLRWEAFLPSSLCLSSTISMLSHGCAWSIPIELVLPLFSLSINPVYLGVKSG